MLFHRAALDLSRPARTFVADLIRGHRRRVGSRWRRLPPGRQALLVLVHLRRNETFAGLAAAFGVGARDRAPLRHRRDRTTRRPGSRPAASHADRAAQGICPPGRHAGGHRPAVRRERPAPPLGQTPPPWRERPVPHRPARRADLGLAGPTGVPHDLTAAREHGIIDALTDRAIACYADKGHVGAGGAGGTPYKRKKHRKPGKRKKLFNRHHATVRALGERGAAALKGWHILRKARRSPGRLSVIVQAILTLHHQDR